MIEIAASRRRTMAMHAGFIARLIAHHGAGITARQRAPWLLALIGRRRRLPDLDHFPANDVIDRTSGAQFFVHAHDGPTHDFAHFHCFVRFPGAQFGVNRKVVMTHIAAIAIDEHGWPTRLLAVNQWVTDEMWQPARRTAALLDRFQFHGRTPVAESGRWVAAVLQVFRPELQALLAVRDARLNAALERHPDKNVLADRHREILAGKRVDLSRRLRSLGAE